jgi:adenylyltransferase/sulfurtransferase
MRFRELALEKDASCPLCGERPTVRSLIDYDAFCGAAAPQSPREPTTMELSATALKEELARGTRIVLLDVREPWECELCLIEGSVPVPMGELPERLEELDRGATIVTVCHKGARSLQAARFLKASGFSNARSLRGGVEAWALDVDPGMTRY